MDQNKKRTALLCSVFVGVLTVFTIVVFAVLFFQYKAKQNLVTNGVPENNNAVAELTPLQEAQKTIDELYAKDDLTPEEYDRLLAAMHIVDLSKNDDKAPEAPMELDEANQVIDELYAKDDLTPEERNRLFAALTVVDLSKDSESEFLPLTQPSELEVVEAKSVVDQYHAKDDLTSEEMAALTDALIVIDSAE